MVGQQQAVRIGLLDRREKTLEQVSVIQIRRQAAGAIVYLCQRRSAEPVLAGANIQQPQLGFALIDLELRRQRAACIGHARERGNDQRYRRDGAVFAAILLPHGLHRQRILADRNGNIQLWTKLHADGLHGVEQRRVFAGMPDRSHPVCRQLDLAQRSDRRCRQIRDRLADGHARRRGRRQHGDRRALAHGHRFAAVTVEIGQSHRAIGHRHLPGTDHRIARTQATDSAITDRDQKRFAADCRQTQHALDRFLERDAVQIRNDVQALRLALGVALHLRQLAEQHIHRQVDRDIATQ